MGITIGCANSPIVYKSENYQVREYHWEGFPITQTHLHVVSISGDEYNQMFTYSKTYWLLLIPFLYNDEQRAKILKRETERLTKQAIEFVKDKEYFLHSIQPNK